LIDAGQKKWRMGEVTGLPTQQEFQYIGTFYKAIKKKCHWFTMNQPCQIVAWKIPTHFEYQV
jgi:hypothetical protein